MKIKRYKKVNRHINFYVNNFGVRSPYQILIDGTFSYAALNNQINIADNIPRYLQSEVKLLTTQCNLIETEKLGGQLGGALTILKKFPLHKCGHEGKPIPGANCLLSMIGKKNDDHYIVATQDRDLQKKLRKIPGVPLLYLHLKTPVLDPPSDISKSTSQNNLQKIYDVETDRIKKIKEINGMGSLEDKPRRKKIKGPNPLSCKKKKIGTIQKVINKVSSKTDIETKKRKKIKNAEHIKQELLKTVK